MAFKPINQAFPDTSGLSPVHFYAMEIATFPGAETSKDQADFLLSIFFNFPFVYAFRPSLFSACSARLTRI
jgi:hypothetical protein